MEIKLITSNEVMKFVSKREIVKKTKGCISENENNWFHQFNSIDNCGVNENSLFVTKKTSVRYICFNVKIIFNILMSASNPNRFPEKHYSR